VCKKAAILALEESRGKSAEAFGVGRTHILEALAQTRSMKTGNGTAFPGRQTERR